MFKMFPKCFRGRSDCSPISCVPSTPSELTDEQEITFNFTPDSFVCSGVSENPEIKQDQYRICFKNHVSDEMSDNDLQDLTSVSHVVSAALLYDALTKRQNGVIEIPDHACELSLTTKKEN